MAEAYTQKDRPMSVTTALPFDTLLLTSFTGQEGMSQLFRYQVNVCAERKNKVAFEDLLGKSVTIKIADGGATRFINGICNRIGQGDSDANFTDYVLDVVPKLWFLAKRARSRIFQHETVPQILKKVLEGIDVAFEVKGTFEPRDYCVQYRETDFNFACRLMEEEGIYYFFKHAENGHTMVLANTPQSHIAIPGGASITFHRTTDPDAKPGRVYSWLKRQEIRSGVFTLRDHTFELAHQPLQASQKIVPKVTAGQVAHQLTAGSNGQLEIYDWPGEYAQRFDGVSAGGGDQPNELKKISTDKDRTVAIRMEQEASEALLIEGASNSPRFTPGHQFTLAIQPGDETAKFLRADGAYVLVSVTHSGNQGDYRTEGSKGFRYQNSFTAIPLELPYRPQRSTPKPFVQGLQTAVIVGPPGEEIFTDKFGRVKVHFHWDREGKLDAGDSCWVRVAQVWAGKRWGASFWPRIGQEVVVAFEEGDPDRPIIVGSVYNSEQMPPYLGDGPDSKHTKDNKVTGIKSNSTLGGAGFNEWRFDDTRGKEQVFFHAERNMDTRVKNDSMEVILHDRHLIVGSEKDGAKIGDQKEKVFQDKHLHVLRNQDEKIDGNFKLLVGHGDAEDGGNVDIVIEKTKKELIEESSHLHIKQSQAILIDGALSQAVGGDQAESVGGKVSLEIKGDHLEKIGGDHTQKIAGKVQQKIGGNHAIEAQEIHLKAGMKLIIEAGVQLSLKGPGGFIDIGPAGVAIQGTMVLINSGGSAGSGSGCTPKEPDRPAKAEDAKQAKPGEPAVADDSKSGTKSAK